MDVPSQNVHGGRVIKRVSPLFSALSIAFTIVLAGCGGSSPSTSAPAGTAAGALDRTVLPIPEPKRQTYKELDARNAKAPARWEVKAPAGAPNVIVILIDDMGFGQASAFGGPIHMPTLERMAQGGLSYNRFHTSADCTGTAYLDTSRQHWAGVEAGGGAALRVEGLRFATREPLSSWHFTR
jgi:arylsulfatase